MHASFVGRSGRYPVFKSPIFPCFALGAFYINPYLYLIIIFAHRIETRPDPHVQPAHWLLLIADPKTVLQTLVHLQIPLSHSYGTAGLHPLLALSVSPKPALKAILQPTWQTCLCSCCCSLLAAVQITTTYCISRPEFRCTSLADYSKVPPIVIIRHMVLDSSVGPEGIVHNDIEPTKVSAARQSPGHVLVSIHQAFFFFAQYQPHRRQQSVITVRSV